MSGSKKRVPLGDTQARGFHSPFAQLLEGAAAPAQTATAEAPPASRSDPADSATVEARLQGLDKAVVRRERKGRGGKTVTLVEGLGSLGEADVGLLLTRLRKALGCGASVEASEAGPVLVLQGDQGDRVMAFLQDSGIKRVVRGS